MIHHHHHSSYPSSQTEPDGRLTHQLREAGRSQNTNAPPTLYCSSTASPTIGKPLNILYKHTMCAYPAISACPHTIVTNYPGNKHYHGTQTSYNCVTSDITCQSYTAVSGANSDGSYVDKNRCNAGNSAYTTSPYCPALSNAHICPQVSSALTLHNC